MRGRNQVYIMALKFLLKVEHYICQSPGVKIAVFTVCRLADLMVLTVNTAHIAAAEKYGPRPFGTRQDRFLSMMVAITGYPGQMAGAAKSAVAFQPVCVAFAWAYLALGQQPLKGCDAFFQLSRFKE
jgi:hypothetical protein